ncbi:MAG TPA: nucleotidyltransferase family protein [Polyangia bacterium]|jgi:molybdenum cofactor cytidylyltransferase
MSGGDVALVVLAAGGSSRLGRPKQLVPFRGQPLLRGIAETARRSTASRVAVVLGARALEILPCLSDTDVTALLNSQWQVGVATSLRRGLFWAMAHDASALLVVSGDQPYLDTLHLDSLIAAHRSSGQPAASVYSGVRGVPAIFPRTLFPDLLELRGDRGAGALLRGSREVVEISWPAGAFDLDEPADLARLAAG